MLALTNENAARLSGESAVSHSIAPHSVDGRNKGKEGPREKIK